MNLSDLPTDLPRPEDDGAANHLLSEQLPDLTLPTTDGGTISLARLSGLNVIYVYPMTGQPDVPLPDNWDQIPGARGCTPQSCAFRDHYSDLKALECDVFGLSTQDTAYQSEAKTRLHLPFALISDHELQLQKSLKLPCFNVENITLYKRLTLITENAKIIKCFYPVFPPDKNAEEVRNWIAEYRSK